PPGAALVGGEVVAGVTPELLHRVELARARQRLDGERARDAVADLLDWLNRVSSARELLSDVARAPVRRPFPRPTAPFPRGEQARRLAAALLSARDTHGGRFTDVLQVAAVPGVDAAVLAVLLLVAGTLEPPPPPPVVGVLLPLRLETRFVEPAVAGAGWTLLVRVVPDAASLDRHQPLAGAGELDAVEKLWRDTGNDLTTDEGRARWSRFAAAVGGAGRAAWLARTFPAVPDGATWRVDRPAQLRPDLATSRVTGLPAELELWLGRGGAAPARVATLAVDPDRLTLEMPDPDTGEQRWWSSFEEARAAGLATEVDLGPTRPDDLDVLVVVGLGDGDPATVFSAHRDAGVLGVLPVGVPTNTVAGAPAADLARDPETWRQLLVSPGAQQGAQEVSLALTGSSAALLPLPGGDPSDVDVNHSLVAALWSAVWGHGLNDVWSLGEKGFGLGLWAADNLVPEGPVPSVRVGDQPYGVLPVTSLGRWKPAPGDAALEEPLRHALRTLRTAAAVAAEGEGTTAGVGTERLLELIGRVPTSRGYSWRWLLPLELVQGLWWAFGAGVPWADLSDWWEEGARPVRDLGAVPGRRYVSLGWPQDLQIPLVEPDNSPFTFEESVNRILSFPPGVLASEGRRRELFQPWPDSLLLRLLVHALAVNAAEVARAHKGDTGPLLDPVVVPASQQTLLQQWGLSFSERQLAGNEQSRLYELARDAAARLATEPVEVLERVLRGVLDTASHRVDPWVTGLAWRRLRSLAGAATPAVFRLGVYGWVDAPRPRTPGAPPDEYLHAPSEAQAMTSAVLRDRALFDADPARWQVDLDSDGVRAAEQLAAEVRLGAHLSEALGRAVERAVAVRSDVERLRLELPIRTEHAGRRVCDGLAVVRALREDPGSLGLSAAQLAAVAPLAEAVDTYGDLLVANAVLDVVSGRAGLAAQSMEAAAGLDAPPPLDVLRTPRAGQSVSTTVVVALPSRPDPAVVDAATSPGLVAEPAVAAYLETVTGAASGAGWTWPVQTEDGAPSGSVTLADLHLLPVDTLGLSGDDLAAAALAHSGAAAAGPAPTGYATCRRLSQVLGSRPVLPADLVDDSSRPADAAVHADLLARYTAVHALGGDLQSALVAAAAGTETEQRSRLRDALRWGITPLQADDPTVATSLARAAAALADRLGSAPTPAEAAAQSVPLLARSLAELVSPEGSLPVLSRLPLDELPVPLVAEPPPSGEALDPDWLEVVAAVRTPLARLEAEQLRRRGTGSDPLATWSSRPGDPWQADLGPDPAPQGLRASTHLVAACGPPGVLDEGADPSRQVALGLLDSWSEVVPGTEHSTHVAFHYDAPGARAPQAILVAVPPVVDEPLDTATLVEIVGETRELARARMAVPSVLDAWSAGAPTTVLPVHDPGVDLDRSP
ncbi:MAG TPA: hypothetical protein VFD41_11260, partial [Actinomycetales bacterium]|nr:hypothetical protein [Actinomycetales bacterium]